MLVYALNLTGSQKSLVNVVQGSANWSVGLILPVFINKDLLQSCLFVYILSVDAFMQ